MQKKLEVQVPEKRKLGTFTRTAGFSFAHYKNTAIKIVYLNKAAIEANKKYFNRIFYEFLMNAKQE